MDGEIFAIFAVALVSTLIFCFKGISIDKYEYLEVMSTYDWKSDLEIQSAMEKRKGHRVGTVGMHMCLGDLIHEGYVVDRIMPTHREGKEVSEHQFKLTDDGVYRSLDQSGMLTPEDILEPV